MNGLLRWILASIVLTLSLTSLQAKQGVQKYWIEFTDKGILAPDFTPGTPLFEKTRHAITNRALERRAACLGTHDISQLVTIEDAPLCEKYVASLRSLGISVSTESRWENAVSAELSPEQFEHARRLPFVRSIHLVRGATPQTVDAPTVSLVHSIPLAPTSVLVQDCSYDSVIYHYGYSEWELRHINVRPLHAMGFDGSGVNYGILDCGFNWRGMRTTRDHRIHGEYDFVFHDSVTANEATDVPNQDGHGSLVLSTATGYLLDSVVGPAYNPDVWLAKTEDLRSETPREEDNYAAALEWMEAQGIDITSSSLGYRTFDSGFVSYNYEDLNGQTAISTRAAAHAAKLGVLVCTAAGNAKQLMEPTLLAPSDADSILSCGAMMYNDTIADFSSNGPSADGRIKPDICAPGVFIASILRDDSLGFENGTSLATPLVSGACVLIKQTHPEAAAMEIRDAVLATARQVVDGLPDNTYGYGEIDAYNAALRLGTIIGKVKLSRVDSLYSVCVPIAANNTIKSARIVYALGSDNSYSSSVPLQLATDSLIYSAAFPPLPHGSIVRFYVEAFDGADTATRSPRSAHRDVYSFVIGDTTTVPGLGVATAANDADVQVYPNPATDHLMIRTAVPEALRCELVDAIGRILASYLITPGEHAMRIILGSLPNGSYQLRMVASSGAVRTRTIVIAR